jgi:ATP-binding cassette, subfamily B, multidrug efflux pump
MRRLLATFLGPYRWRIALVMSLVAVQALGNLYLPSLNADIINYGVIRGDTDYILHTGAFMLGVTLVLGVCSIVGVYFGAMTAMAVGRDIRSALFRKVMEFSQQETNAFGTPSLITRNTNDVTQVQMVLVMAFNIMIMAPIMAVGGVVMAIREDVPLSGLLVVIIPTVILVISLVALRALPLFRSLQSKTDRVNQVMREKLAGMRVIRAFARTEREERRFDEANRDLTATQLRVNQLFAMMIPFLFAVMNLSTVAIVWFGGLRIDSGGMQIGNLAAFLQYVMMVLFSVLMAALIFIMVPRAAASAERIQQVLEVEEALCDPDEPQEIAAPRGVVEFRDVEFRYPGAEDAVLCSISFTARPGETTAIVGSTGSGKSTLVNLIPRFYDVTSGAVLVDGVDVRNLRQEDLWRLIGAVPQKAFLFSGSVATNLRYGNELADEAAVWRALTISQAGDFVREMEGGLEAEIDQGGANVSGGQRQRLAIARAVIKEPKIYVFDDSFSALDFATDRRLRRALKAETAESTVIIVASRVGTIMQADQIVVLEDGEIAGIGTHAQLMKECKTYREIVLSQLTEEEVA